MVAKMSFMLHPIHLTWNSYGRTDLGSAFYASHFLIDVNHTYLFFICDPGIPINMGYQALSSEISKIRLLRISPSGGYQV
jgi:hypothetical protein